MNGFLGTLFSNISNSVLGDISAAENYAVEAFAILAGELLVIILLLASILIWGVAVA